MTEFPTGAPDGPYRPPIAPPIAPAPELAPARPAVPWLTRRDLLVAAGIIVTLAALGVGVGVIWWAISPGRPLGLYVTPHAVIADETESFISTDGRFVLLNGALGLVAGIATWLFRSWRGPVTVLALAVGGFVGSVVADRIGQLLGGGASTGPSDRAVILPLQVHAHGLLIAEALVAVAVYALCTLFANRDDLGRDAVDRDAGSPVPPSVPAAPAAPSWPGSAGAWDDPQRL